MSGMSSGTLVGSVRRLTPARGAVRMEDVYDTEIDDLWTSLTDPTRLARWVATVEGELRVGGRIQARFTSGWEGPGRIDTCDAPHHLSVTFDPGTPDETVAEAWLTSDGDTTRLIVEERGIPLDELAAHGAGWQAHVEDLTAHLSGSEPGDWARRWAELTPTYVELASRMA
jgi:uncharacterized protein YndB with AHSA1/START domain